MIILDNGQISEVLYNIAFISKFSFCKSIRGVNIDLGQSTLEVSSTLKNLFQRHGETSE